jgi:hypothetical protein
MTALSRPIEDIDAIHILVDSMTHGKTYTQMKRLKKSQSKPQLLSHCRDKARHHPDTDRPKIGFQESWNR